MQAKYAKRKEQTSNPIVGTAPGVETSNHFITESNDGYDPFRLGSSNVISLFTYSNSTSYIAKNKSKQYICIIGNSKQLV